MAEIFLELEGIAKDFSGVSVLKNINRGGQGLWTRRRERGGKINAMQFDRWQLCPKRRRVHNAER